MIDREIAFAKINLALHVRGRRCDGYHDIETVFAFCKFGDVVSGELSTETSLTIDGPFASGLSARDNSVIDAAKAMRIAGRLLLQKNLPVASGIGGGSADAAATLRLLARLSCVDLPTLPVQRALGADVPACVVSSTVRGEGVGEALVPAASVTGMPILLVNPRVALSTAMVFRQWDGRDRGPLTDWREGRNDLEEPAQAIVPQIVRLLAWLRQREEVVLARMSGSGATCFALFDDDATRNRAHRAVTEAFPKFWVRGSNLR